MHRDRPGRVRGLAVVLIVVSAGLGLDESAAGARQTLPELPHCPPQSVIAAVASDLEIDALSEDRRLFPNLIGSGGRQFCVYRGNEGHVEVVFESPIDEEAFEAGRDQVVPEFPATTNKLPGVGDLAFVREYTPRKRPSSYVTQADSYLEVKVLKGLVRVTVTGMYDGGNTPGGSVLKDKTLSQSRLVDIARASMAALAGAPERTLRVSVVGTGSVSGGGLRCPGPCMTTKRAGTKIRLTQKAGKGWRFQNWAGDCQGRASCAVQLREDALVTAVFVRK